MKNIFIDQAIPGMVIAQPVVSKIGNVLLDEKTVLTSALIDNIKKWGIDKIQIEEEIIKLEEKVQEEPVPDISLPVEELMPEELGIDVETKTPPPMKLNIQDIDKAISTRIIGRTPTRTPPIIKKFVYNRKKIEQAKQIISQIHQTTHKSTATVMKKLSNYKKVDKDEILKIINKLVEEAMQNKDILTNLTTVKNYDNYLLAHSINVCILSVVTGYSYGMDVKELMALGEAALLHDIGMAKVPWHIWNKEGILTEDERLQVTKHTIYGADILLEIQGISKIADVVAYQHHERLNGSGYPKGVKHFRIHEMSKIVAVCDVFEAMTSPRKYRKKFFSNQAISYILTRAGINFDQNIVKAFVRHMSMFPIGSLVKLTDRRLGLIVSANPDHPLRPILKVVRESDGTESNNGTIIDLLNDKKILIQDVIHPEEYNINIFQVL